MRYAAIFRTLLLLGAMSTSVFGLASTSQAATYGPLAGSTVTFENINDVDDLFGAPTASGNTMDFTPTLFEADCPNVACPDVVVGQLVFDVRANAGNVIDNIIMQEAGDLLLGTFVIGDTAFTSVSASIFVDIFDVDFAPVNTINFNDQLTFDNGGQWTRDHAVDGVGTTTIDWNGDINIDLNSLIAGAGETGKATLVRVTMNNFLVANAAGSGTAFIQKKDIDGVSVTVVPEPGTALLFSLGLFGLASFDRSGNRAGRKEDR